MTVLVDASALVGLADADSPDRDGLEAFVKGTKDVLRLPTTVLAEADYIVLRRLGVRSELLMLRSIAAGDFLLEDLTKDDLSRAMELVEQYATARIGLVDASIVAIAERLNVGTILTLDRRHFRMIRPRHRPFFEIVP